MFCSARGCGLLLTFDQLRRDLDSTRPASNYSDAFSVPVDIRVPLGRMDQTALVLVDRFNLWP